MKRFKKLTIYILVGVLLSSSIMLSYRKADEVKAAAGAITLSAAALVAIGLLGAYGIVYKGAVDSTTGNYVWQSQPDSYPQELENALPYLAQLYNTLVYQAAQNGGYDPNDDWDGDEDKPPIWDKLVKFMNENQTKALALGGTVLSSIVAAIGYGLYQESQKPKEGNYLSGTGTLTSSIQRVGKNYDVSYYARCVVTEGSNIKSVVVKYQYSGSPYIKLLFYSDSSFKCYMQNELYPNDNTPYSASKTSNGYYYIARTIGLVSSDTIPSSTPSLIDTNVNLGYDSMIGDFIAELEADKDMIWSESSELFNQENTGISSDIKIDTDNETLEPIFPFIQIPSVESVGDFLGGLSTNVGNESGTQAVVDQFVNSLQQTQPNPNPEGGVVPDPNPNPNPEPNPNPNPNPDVGGEEGEEDSEKDKSNLLADLKDVFPFCIPFDLIDCFRLFNAEPETPRVEIPLHFGIIDKDYTFVIDLKDFDGVAQVCRTMFLILFITGLVLSTRSLIRG